MFIRSLFLILIACQCWAVTTVTIAVPATAQAGVSGSITLTATVTGPAGTIAWTHVSGPGTGTFGSSTSLSTTYTAPTRSTTSADYVARATYTNSDGATFAEVHIGAVLVDVNDVVITGDATADKLLGPLTRFGSSPWPYFDIADRALVDTIVTTALAHPPTLGTAYTGTVQVFSDGFTQAHLVGTGTLFTSQMAPGDQILIAWNTVDGSGTGRHWDQVASISDDTHLVLGTFQNQIDLASGLTIYRMPAISGTFAPFWWCIPCGEGTARTWNYYDVVLAAYRLYYRTGILSYLTQARQFADLWWQWSIDHGRAGMPPRYTSLHSQFIRAVDGHSERFPDLQIMTNNFLPGGVLQRKLPSSLTNQGTTFEGREPGYNTWFQALGAASDPDSGRHATYCSNLTSIILPTWNTWQQPNGYWSEDNYFISSGGYTYKLPGASPWREDIPIHGLQAAYERLIDSNSTTGCYNLTIAATTLTTITKGVQWTYTRGRSNPSLGGNGGVYYDAEYETNGQVPLTGTGGTVDISLSGTTVTGHGTTFLSTFGSSGKKYIGFQGSFTMYKVTASSTDTSMTITPAFGAYGEPSNLTGSTFVGADQAFTTCASAATFCWDAGFWPPAPPNGDRNLVRLMPGITGWLYHFTGDLQWKIAGDAWFSNAFGGPAAGPGQGGPCGGPDCDGVETDFTASLPFCGGVGAGVPCSTNNYSPANVYQNLGKNYGQGSGAPGAQNYLAWRLLTPAPPFIPYRSTVFGQSLILGGSKLP